MTISLKWKRVGLALGSLAAFMVAAAMASRGSVSRPAVRVAQAPVEGLEGSGLVGALSAPEFDSLRNTSRLDDDQLRYYFEGLMEEEAARVLDQDEDGIADGTRVEVMEFIERMKIILGDRQPFVYRVTPQGLPIVRGAEL